MGSDERGNAGGASDVYGLQQYYHKQNDALAYADGAIRKYESVCNMMVENKGGVKMLIKRRIAQSTAEYAILLSLVIAAALGVQNEVRRALQARIHDAATGYLVQQTNQLGQTSQWEPGTLEKTTSGQFSDRKRTEDDSNAAEWTNITENSGATVSTSHQVQ